MQALQRGVMGMTRRYGLPAGRERLTSHGSRDSAGAGAVVAA
jgi:hypothetical protein